MDEVDIHQKQKDEQKELNSKIQGLKHSIPKGDKKRKKEINAEIAILTAQLEERQAQEIANVAKNSNSINCNDIASLNMNNGSENTVPETLSQPKISKAQKRREKKEAEERARQKRIEEDNIDSGNHSRNIEAALFDKILDKEGLKIFEINPDGNCMYNAIVANLHGQPCVEELNRLRKDTSEFLLKHRDDFIPFTSNNKTGDMLSPDEYSTYCNDIKETNSWGGELELRAISQIIKMPIEVYQANAPILLIGEEFKSNPIRLSYHHHQYGLGEHYNALIQEKHEK